MHDFENKDFLTVKGLERADIEAIFDASNKMEKILKDRTRIDLLKDKILGVAFFQVSTRTRMSFESAMQRLGGGVVGFSDPKTTRAGDYYAESIQDVARMMESYCDAMVIRHPENGAPEKAAEVINIPVINAGDGYNEHPTQGLLDVYSILKAKGRIDGLKIGLVGDTSMRVMHSLNLVLSHFDVEVQMISTPEKALSEPWRNEYKKAKLRFIERIDFDEALKEVDVLYMFQTKTPSYSEGRSEAKQERPKQPFIITSEKLEKAKRDIIILHPLPRTEELPTEIDSKPAAYYFVQAYYGVAVRMALLAYIFGKSF